MEEKKQVYIFSFLTVLFWAFAFPFTKVAMKHFSPYSLGFIRVTIASITLLIIGIKAGNRIPKFKDLPLLFITGACGFGLYLFTFNRGILTISSATSSIVIALTPIFTALWASILYNEKLNIVGIISMITAFIGVCIIMLQKGLISINYGILWTMCSSLFFSIYNILNRKLSSMGYRPIEIVTYSLITSAIELCYFSQTAINEIKTADISALFIVLMLGILSSAIAYYLWSKALSIAKNTSDVTNFGFVTPLLATIIGGIVLNEIPSLMTFIGGITIICSVIIFAKKGKKSI